MQDKCFLLPAGRLTWPAASKAAPPEGAGVKVTRTEPFMMTVLPLPNLMYPV